MSKSKSFDPLVANMFPKSTEYLIEQAQKKFATNYTDDLFETYGQGIHPTQNKIVFLSEEDSSVFLATTPKDIQFFVLNLCGALPLIGSGYRETKSVMELIKAYCLRHTETFGDYSAFGQLLVECANCFLLAAKGSHDVDGKCEKSTNAFIELSKTMSQHELALSFEKWAESFLKAGHDKTYPTIVGHWETKGFFSTYDERKYTPFALDVAGRQIVCMAVATPIAVCVGSYLAMRFNDQFTSSVVIGKTLEKISAATGFKDNYNLLKDHLMLDIISTHTTINTTPIGEDRTTGKISLAPFINVLFKALTKPDIQKDFNKVVYGIQSRSNYKLISRQFVNAIEVKNSGFEKNGEEFTIFESVSFNDSILVFHDNIEERLGLTREHPVACCAFVIASAFTDLTSGGIDTLKMIKLGIDELTAIKEAGEDLVGFVEFLQTFTTTPAFVRRDLLLLTQSELVVNAKIGLEMIKKEDHPGFLKLLKYWVGMNELDVWPFKRHMSRTQPGSGNIGLPMRDIIPNKSCWYYAFNDSNIEDLQEREVSEAIFERGSEITKKLLTE